MFLSNSSVGIAVGRRVQLLPKMNPHRKDIGKIIKMQVFYSIIIPNLPNYIQHIEGETGCGRSHG